MRNRPFRILMAIMVIALHGWAQSKPEPPRRAHPSPAGIPSPDTSTRGEKPLPPIELPEYDITGKLIPGVEDSRKGESAGAGALDPLGRGTLRSREGGWGNQSLWKEGASPVPAAGSRYARVEAGYGSFISPFANASLRSSIGEYSLGMNGGYGLTDGHVPFADEKQGRFAASIGWGMGAGEGDLVDPSIGLFTSYAGRRYHPFGSTKPSETRSFNRFEAGAGIADLPIGRGRVSGTVSFGSASIAGDETLRHTRLGFAGTGEVGLDEFRLHGGLDLSLSSFANVTGSSTPYLLRLTLLAGRDLTEDLRIQAGVSGTAFRGSEPGGKGKFFPLAAVTWFAAEGLDITLRYEPAVREGYLESLGGENPYLSYSTELRHEEVVTDLSLATQFTPARPFRVRLVTQYQRFSPYLALIDTAGRGVWETYSGGISEVFTLRGDILWELTPEDLFSVTIRGIASENSATGAGVSYLPTVRGEFGYVHRFRFGLLASADVQMVGSRTSDLRGEANLDPFVLSSLAVEYPIIPGFRARGRIGNLFGVRHVWWLGYAGIPRHAGLSLSYSW